MPCLISRRRLLPQSGGNDFDIKGLLLETVHDAILRSYRRWRNLARIWLEGDEFLRTPNGSFG